MGNYESDPFHKVSTLLITAIKRGYKEVTAMRCFLMDLIYNLSYKESSF